LQMKANTSRARAANERVQAGFLTLRTYAESGEIASALLLRDNGQCQARVALRWGSEPATSLTSMPGVG
jgi:hypothetical protein